jgi:hypothetical protein
MVAGAALSRFFRGSEEPAARGQTGRPPRAVPLVEYESSAPRKARARFTGTSLAMSAHMRASFVTCLGIGISFIAACGAPSPSDIGDASDEAISQSCSNVVPAQTLCDRNTVLAGVTGGRADALKRGFAWLDARVPYNQGAYRDHYRTDCSGFVSMCWQTGLSYDTVAFIHGQGKDSLLGSYDDLVPGDALVYRNPDLGHTLLFAGWADASHKTACVIQEGGTPVRDNSGQSELGSAMKFGSVSTTYLQCKGFKAIRSNSLPADQVTDGDVSGDDPPPVPGNKPPAPGTGTCNRVGGPYCGNPASNLKGDPDTLYVCDSSHHLEEVRACPNGCKVNATGVDDECNPDDPSSPPDSGSAGLCLADGDSCAAPSDCCGYDDGSETCAEDPNYPGYYICQPTPI